VVNVRDDAKITDETWVHQVARRRNLAPVKFLLESAAIGSSICQVPAADISLPQQSN
jgi:hypothetical protein